MVAREEISALLDLGGIRKWDEEDEDGKRWVGIANNVALLVGGGSGGGRDG